MNKPIRDCTGFSLIEVLIAMAIMSSAAMLLYVAWSGNQIRVQKMAINNKAAFYLDQVMGELQAKYETRILQLPDSEQGTFENDPDYKWKMETQDFQMPDLRALLVSDKQGQEALLLIIDKLTEYMNDSVKEMKVTVTYTRGKKSVDYSATTFMVDYNRPLPIGVPGASAGGSGGGS